MKLMGELSLSSPVFDHLGEIPRKYTCDVKKSVYH